MYPLSKILWWQEECSQLFSITWKFLCWEDFLALKLCGTATMSHSLASQTMGFDIRRTYFLNGGTLNGGLLIN
jgi:sugar (pentulose or hexulose) kinase